MEYLESYQDENDDAADEYTDPPYHFGSPGR